ncbi:coiled-coil-helix-coiled-coil-helix domain-containing protein 7-like [Babylonia areolata]|uniref:coiled-coil-helix-coiled-coil-helix domain-containing protein 7-like n=1 Tax=Babylonia areolata TaxID=304850 RepID=UPI003FD052E0
MSSATEKPASKGAGDLSRRVRVEKASRQADIDKNPCTKEQQMSFQCLDDNAYDRDKCSKHFLNYKHCREFWSLVVSDRKRKDIKPYLPAPEDRKQALQDYKHIMPWK